VGEEDVVDVDFVGRLLAEPDRVAVCEVASSCRFGPRQKPSLLHIRIPKLSYS
jgi:hypothetical protein